MFKRLKERRRLRKLTILDENVYQLGRSIKSIETVGWTTLRDLQSLRDRLEAYKAEREKLRGR